MKGGRGLAWWLGAGALIILALVGAASAALFLWPLGFDSVARAGNASAPANTHEEALAAFAAVEAAEARIALNERCRSTLLTHGTKTARSVVFLHGLTNCPAQADVLAPQLYALGYNVYVPRLPGHGEADGMTTALATLSAEEIAASAEAAFDLAEGLGDEVVVFGISFGATAAAWLAQTRGDADRVVLIAPYLGRIGYPTWTARPISTALRLVPNRMMWWNEADPFGATEMGYAYPRYATHVVGEVMRLGLIVDGMAHRTPPLAPEISVLINEADDAASNPLVEQLVAAWRDHGREVDVRVLPAALGLLHDVVDPRQPFADIDLVYPIIIDMIDGSGPSSPVP